jgi:ABC-2 type transport system ATP-binding protein
MREGEIVADSAPAELRERTGTTDLEDAFVRAVEPAA